MTADVQNRAAHYVTTMQLPARAVADAVHLACASWYAVDYLLTWNMAHIASGKARKLLERTNKERGIAIPTICTPEELMEP